MLQFMIWSTSTPFTSFDNFKWVAAGVLLWLVLSMPNFFTLGNKYGVFHLFDLYTKKVSQFSHTPHSKFRLLLMNKMLDHLVRHSSKHNIIYVYLGNHKSPIFSFDKLTLVCPFFSVSLIDQEFCNSFLNSSCIYTSGCTRRPQIIIIPYRPKMHRIRRPIKVQNTIRITNQWHATGRTSWVKTNLDRRDVLTSLGTSAWHQEKHECSRVHTNRVLPCTINAEMTEQNTFNNLPPEDIRPAAKALPNVPTMFGTKSAPHNL
jgi:hypothetical protein